MNNIIDSLKGKKLLKGYPFFKGYLIKPFHLLLYIYLRKNALNVQTKNKEEVVQFT